MIKHILLIFVLVFFITGCSVDTSKIKSDLLNSTFNCNEYNCWVDIEESLFISNHLDNGGKCLVEEISLIKDNSNYTCYCIGSCNCPPFADCKCAMPGWRCNLQ